MQRQPTPLDNAGQMSIDQLQERALNIIYNVASIFTMPLEMLLRPWYGSLYFSAANQFFTAMFLMLLSAFSTVTQTVAGMIPFVHIRGPVGVYSIGSLTELFFLSGIIHGVRIWRRMIHPETEDIATFEGPALPVFGFLPKGDSFWFVRIIYEPALVFALSIVLSTMLIIQSPLMIYLQIAALFLAMKEYVAWFKNWSYLRRLMDISNAAPIIARIVNNSASNEEMARVHLASLPKNLPPEIRKATIAHISRAYVVPGGEE